DKKEPEDNPLVHVFEKVQTAEDYKGGLKNLDGQDELEDHADALEELDLRHVIRSRDRAHSIYKSDAFVDSNAPDLVDDEEEGRNLDVYFYDEWDHKVRRYKKDWCKVWEWAPPERGDGEANSDF